MTSSTGRAAGDARRLGQEETPRAPARSCLLEAIGRSLEAPPWLALYRLAIGFCLVPLGAWWHGGAGSGWHLLPVLLMVLLALRLVPALVRRLLPVSEDLRLHWARRRLLAKRFDSYQWRKLVWFGLGLAAYLAVVGQAPGVPTALAVACLIVGGFGTLRWRHLIRLNSVALTSARNGGRPSRPAE